MKTQIITENLILQEITKRDLPSYTKLIREDNKELSSWTTIPYPISRSKVLEFYKETKENRRNEMLYIIVDKKTKEIMGAIHPIKKPINNSVGIGYWIGLYYRNKGYMTEAVKKIIEESFKDSTVQRIEITVHEKNVPSETVIKKCGFTYEGTHRMAAYNGFHIYGNLKMYSIIKSDWEKR
ncbi:MAG: GNAT family protein [Nanoarchaeota archaeon]